MKVNANWCAKMVALSMVFALMFMALSCGGNGSNNVGLEGTPTITGNNTVTETNGTRGTGVLITEEDIANLPRWQQELLSDPGWNQPYIEPPVDTEIEGPSYEMLMELTRQKLEAGMSINPRSNTQGKSASWGPLGPTALALVRGEYNDGPGNMTPDFGCNDNGSNESGNLNALEDLINSVSMPINPANFVQEGLTSPNYFNNTGGSSGDFLSAVYQLFAEDPSTDMTDPNQTWAEVSYNSGLLGGGIGPGGDCSGAVAIPVEGAIWRCFNREITATPGLNPTEVYNMLVAPADDASADMLSSGDSTFSYQPFYFGTTTNCFGGAWIVSISSSTSDCDTFADFFADDPSGAQEFFTNPVYGILLKRWQEMSADGMPWETNFGLPVFGPFAYAGGSPVLTGKGQYYAWGMWFERGFAWWIDYDNEGVSAPYPNATDEAQAYTYVGDNVYCDVGLPSNEAYIKLPTVFYGGQGELGVSVSAQAMRFEVTEPWMPVDFVGDHYEVGLAADDGLDTVSLALFAQGFGGTPDADCNYKTYIWALRNGSIVVPGGSFNPDDRFLNATYGSEIDNRESIYVVRVQITDSLDNIAYGDSFPIHLGHGATGGTSGSFATVTIVNTDEDGDWPTNLAAIEDDLQLLVDDEGLEFSFSTVDYTGGIGQDIVDDGNVFMVMWYVGGPQAGSGEPNNTTPWTEEQADDMDILRQNGLPVVLIDQHIGLWDSTSWSPNNGGPHFIAGGVILQFGSVLPQMFPDAGVWDTYETGHQILGLNSFDVVVPSYYPNGVPIHGTNTGGGNYVYNASFFPLDRTLGEAYVGAGSCGASYVSGGYALNNNTQGQTWRCVNFSDPGNPLSYVGAIRGLSDYYWTFFGHGNVVNAQYHIGYSWSDLVLTAGAPFTPTRAQTLQNIMASLDSDIWTYGSGGGGGFGEGGAFSPYIGDDPEIVMVKPVFWHDDGTYDEGAASSAALYPDPTSTDIFRTTDDPALSDEIFRTSSLVTDPAPGSEDGLNGNDLDMQAPFYGYWHYGPDGLTELGPDGTGNPADAVDDILWAGGVCVNNVDFDADTFDDYRLNAGDPGIFGTPAGSRQVTGYYANSSGSDPLTDGHVEANYGVNVPSLAFDGRDGVMSYEAIARWAPTGSLPNGLEAHGTNPARLRWSMYPGHGVVIPDGGQGFPEYGKQLSWKQFLGDHPIANGDVGTYRDYAGFLRPAFTLGGNDALTDGRILDFDYRDILGWYTDFNGNFVHGDLPNGVDDQGDKFPVRARLITHWTAYYANNGEALFPNTMPDPATFMEVGCYVVDISAGDPGVQIVDDADQPDPGFDGTFDNAASPDYSIDLYFEIVGGTGPYDVYLDPAYDIDTFDPLNPLATFGDVIGETLVGNYPSEGLKSAMDVTYTDNDGGDRIFALRVADAALNVGFMFYADPVAVGPPMQVAILDDPMSANSNAYDNLVADISEIYGASVITTFDLSTDLSAGDLDGFDGVLWATDYPIQNYFGGLTSTPPHPMNMSWGTGNVNLNVVRDFTSAGGTFFLSNPGSFRFTFATGYVANMQNILPFRNGYFYSGYSPSSERGDFLNGVESYPNSLTGLYNYIASPIGPTYNSVMGPATLSGSIASIDSYNNSTFWVAGMHRLNPGPCVQVLMNWGDFSESQQGGTRAECLQNLLCMAGDNPDPWDPSYVPPEPTTVLYQDDLDGGTVGSASFTAEDHGGDFGDTWTVFDGGTYGFGGTNVSGDAYAYSGVPLGHPVQFGIERYGNNNRKTLYWGPMDFSAETSDPMFWVRYFSNQESSGTTWDRIWVGWSDSATHEWSSGYSTPPTWNYNEIVGDAGTIGSAILNEVQLTGAAGEASAYVTIQFTSDGSVDWYEGTWMDNFTVGTYGLPPTDI